MSIQGVHNLQPETELSTCFVQPISDNEENKHDKVTFLLACIFSLKEFEIITLIYKI